MNISEKQVNRKKAVRFKELDDNGVLLNLENGNYYTLNHVGTFVWKLMDGERSVEEIVARVTEKYEVDREEAERDINSLLTDLEKEGLVRLAHG